MVGVGHKGEESVLAHVSIVNDVGTVIYESHVQTVEKVVDYRTQYSGVKPHHLRAHTGAKPFAQVQKEVADLIRNRIVVGHSLESDFKALLLTHPWHLRRDTARYRPLMRGKNKPHALRFLARQILGIQIQHDTQGHDPVRSSSSPWLWLVWLVLTNKCALQAEDARAALLVYKHLKKDWERAIKLRVAKRKGKSSAADQKASPKPNATQPTPMDIDDDSDGDSDAE